MKTIPIPANAVRSHRKPIAFGISLACLIALIGLGVACWPGPPLVGMFIYSATVALFLSHVGFADDLAGVFLWPVAVVHVILTAFLTRDVTRLRPLKRVGWPSR